METTLRFTRWHLYFELDGKPVELWLPGPDRRRPFLAYSDVSTRQRKRKSRGPFSDELIDQQLAQAPSKDAESLLGESDLVRQLLGERKDGMTPNLLPIVYF